MYVSEAVFTAGYSDAGLALDFHRSYNTTHHDPKRYFSSLESVPIDELSPCNETDMSSTQRMGAYLEHSGDQKGVEKQTDGNYFANCSDGIWWIAPACRTNVSRCIPTLTSSNGWRLQAMMQWSTAYDMPTAIGIVGDFSSYVKRVKNISALFYWWVPDSTLIDLKPLQIIFPRHSPSAWAAGDKKTSGAGSFVGKMVSKNLASKARTVQEFVSGIRMELGEIQGLLLKTQSEPVYDIVCQWMREKKTTWQQWLPVETHCFEGFGMVDSFGDYAKNRSGAVSCGLCQAGTYSQETADDLGRTYVCVPCPPGSSQSKASSTGCEPCPKGTATAKWGMEACEPCSAGAYQNLQGQSNCTPCGMYRTTLLLGASAREDCVCEAGRLEDIAWTTFNML